MASVLQPWMEELPLMMQGTLMTGIRGNDITPLSGMKPLTRWLRSLCLVNGNPENDFMDVPVLPKVEEFEDELEYVTIHYFLHFIHCLEIVGYKHPDAQVRDRALDYYDRLVDWCHLLPEPEEHLDFRLSGEAGTTGAVRRWRPGQRLAGKVLESLQVRALQRRVDSLEASLVNSEEARRRAESVSVSYGRGGS